MGSWGSRPLHPNTRESFIQTCVIEHAAHVTCSPSLTWGRHPCLVWVTVPQCYLGEGTPSCPGEGTPVPPLHTWPSPLLPLHAALCFVRVRGGALVWGLAEPAAQASLSGSPRTEPGAAPGRRLPHLCPQLGPQLGSASGPRSTWTRVSK